MKMLIVIYAGAEPDRVREALECPPVGGYTMMEGAHGVGSTGPRLGTRAWPGESTIFFSFVPDEAAAVAADTVREVQAALPEGEGLHLAVLPLDLVV